MADLHAAPWRAEECSDEYMENCRCIVVAGEGDRVKYIADAETPELAARIVADHNQALGLNEGVAADVREQITQAVYEGVDLGCFDEEKAAAAVLRVPAIVESLMAVDAVARVRKLAERWRYTGDRKGGPLRELLATLNPQEQP